MFLQVVSTSRTPGHTKHFQTIYLTPTIRLCDCPGLVFPSLVNKQIQVILCMTISTGKYVIVLIPCYSLPIILGDYILVSTHTPH